MRRTHRSDLEFSYASASQARLVERAVRVETDEIEGDRTTARVERTAATLTVGVVASDLTALRAGVNTWTTLVGVAEAAAGAGARHRDRSGASRPPD